MKLRLRWRQLAIEADHMQEVLPKSLQVQETDHWSAKCHSLSRRSNQPFTSLSCLLASRSSWLSSETQAFDPSFWEGRLCLERTTPLSQRRQTTTYSPCSSQHSWAVKFQWKTSIRRTLVTCAHSRWRSLRPVKNVSRRFTPDSESRKM